MTQHAFDDRIMTEVLGKAETFHGETYPNPQTAACIVKDGRIISWGIHEKAGGKHAEVLAIEAAGLADISDATLYVNLEPCTHHGKTPPCVDTIIKAGIKRVVWAMTDPNPNVRKHPASAQLKNAGIEVSVGVLEEAAHIQNRVFITNQIKNRPFIRFKAAISLDGKIALSNGKSHYISNEKSREKVHQIRKKVSAIAIGANTIRVDNPSLNTRLSGQEAPAKCILIFSDSGNIPEDSFFFDKNPNAKIICVTPDNVKLSPELSKKTVQWTWPNAQTLKDMLPDIMQKAYEVGVCDLLIEGGSQLYTTFLDAKLVDEYHLFIAPYILGGVDDIPLVSSASQPAESIRELVALQPYLIDILDNNIYHQSFSPELWDSIRVEKNE